jgi:hypothetical protein
VKRWELIARERIRDSLAQYAWSGDALRLSELAESFCENGVLEVRGHEPIHGREQIVGFLGGVVELGEASSPIQAGARRIVRHNLSNIRFLELEPDRALVAPYFTVFTERGLDHFGRYRDTFEPVGERWLIRHRFVSTDWTA